MNNQIDLNLTPEQVRQLPPAKRLPYIKYIRLKYPRAEQILSTIRDCYESNAFSADPQCLLLVGPTCPYCDYTEHIDFWFMLDLEDMPAKGNANA